MCIHFHIRNIPGHVGHGAELVGVATVVESTPIIN